MGKPIQALGKKPPYFRECSICHREFGSRSLDIHMSRCLERLKSSSDQESDSKSPKKSPLKIKGLKSHKLITSDEEDDEVETSLSDELNHCWPSSKAINKSNLKVRRPNHVNRGMAVKNRRKRSKKIRSDNTMSSGDDESRPKTATLKRPHILDESLKDKVDMTLTKKEFLAAVKLCTDAAVQRGHPNMRIKANKGQKAAKGFQSQNNSPYMTKILGKIKKKVIPQQPTETNTKVIPEIRPKTTKLERPSNANLDLPQINVKPQVVISKSLSRHLKLKNKIKKTIEETKKEPELRINLVGKQTKATTKPTKGQNNKGQINLIPKDKVPEPCKSCGRSDFPERLHTHNDKSVKKAEKAEKSVKKPWLSPKRPRALSLDTTVTLSLNSENGDPKQNKKLELKQMQKSVKDSMASLRVVDISDEVTDMEMSNNESSEDKSVTITEVNTTTKKQNNSRMSVDDSSSANESSSEVISLPKSLRKSKRPPPPVNLNRNKNLELQSVPDSNNEELDNNNSVLGLVNCPLCGKQFGKNSIKFHTRQCQKRQQILKDRQESDKKSPPQQPIEEAEDTPFIHEAIWEAHVQQLIPCKNCGRTFFPDRIKVHQKSCKGLTVKGNVPGNNLPNNQVNSNNSNAVNSSLDFLMMNSPSLMRRTLHHQDDTVNTSSNYQESMLKQIQTTNQIKKTVE